MNDLIDCLKGRPVYGHGEIASRIIKNTFTGRDLQIEHVLTASLDCGKPEIASEPVKLQITIPGSGVRCWQDWSGRTLTFPRWPELGSIDGLPAVIGEHASGAISTDDQRLLAICTSVTIGALSGLRAPAVVCLGVLVEPDPTFRAEGFDAEIALELEIGDVLVIGEVGQRGRPQGAEADAMARCFIDTDRYEPVTQQGLTSYRPQVDRF